MSTQSSGEARRAILASIRRNLKASQPHDARRDGNAFQLARATPQGLQSLPSGSTDPGVTTDSAPRVAEFRRRLESVGASCSVFQHEHEAASELERLIEEAGARRIAVSDAPLLKTIISHVNTGTKLLSEEAVLAGELFECEIGITSAQWGIAETGTLVLESERERHRLISLIPPVHIAVIAAQRIVGTMSEALARVRGQGSDDLSRAVTFITGPSRTADIELTLALGMHGPRALHVLVISDDSNNMLSSAGEIKEW